MNTMTASRSGEQSTEEPVWSTVALQRTAGITYRQANYWTSQGYLIPLPRRESATGSGIPMFFTADEVAIATRIGELTRIGLALQIAALYARRAPASADELINLVKEIDLP